MSTLRSTLNALATNLAWDILEVIRSSSLEDLLGERGGHPGRAPKSMSNGAAKPSRATRSGRLPRRSAEEIATALDQIVALVGKHKDGMRAEEIRKALKLDVREVPRVLKEGLATKKLRAKGRKRATTYTVAA